MVVGSQRDWQAGCRRRPQSHKGLPIVYVLGRPNDPRAERLRAIYTQSALSEEDVAEVITILDASQARAYAEGLAHRDLGTALAELAVCRRGNPDGFLTDKKASVLTMR